LKSELEKSVRVHKPYLLQEAVYFAILHQEDFFLKKVGSFETQTKYTTSWSAPVNSQQSHSITSLQQNHPIASVP